MNAKGLTWILAGLNADLNMTAVGQPSFYQKLVNDGAVSQSELDGTRNILKAAEGILRDTPEEKIEALVAQHNEDLTAYSDKFNALGSGPSIAKFRLAQIMSGTISTIMAKAGVRG